MSHSGDSLLSKGHMSPVPLFHGVTLGQLPLTTLGKCPREQMPQQAVSWEQWTSIALSLQWLQSCHLKCVLRRAHSPKHNAGLPGRPELSFKVKLSPTP
jgi:hypothetical protein